MKCTARVAWGCCLALTGCAGLPWEGSQHRVRLEDNIGGHSAAKAESTVDAVRIQVAQFAQDCRLQTFLVGPRQGPERGADEAALGPLSPREPEVLEGGRASLTIYAPGNWIARAQYVHTVLVDEGEKSEPDGQAQAWGAGDLRVGHHLGGGYTYDHVEFSSHVQGPGGASARVSQYPVAHSHDGSMTIHWYYDEYSKVQFQWKIYAQGPCDTKPD
jgi:hypothetical protein